MTNKTQFMLSLACTELAEVKHKRRGLAHMLSANLFVILSGSEGSSSIDK
jgi:hypothetical protein